MSRNYLTIIIVIDSWSVSVRLDMDGHWRLLRTREARSHHATSVPMDTGNHEPIMFSMYPS